ncbi:MAG TPA: PatB family C-S lyase [Burkholderiales bacterium]|nr:PatB family C-S lyase [Burkholderiales bacterium]
MTFDFDQIIDRGNTAATKWDKYAGRDVIPMWVADMDFRSSPAIIEALKQRADHGVFGYTEPSDELNDAIIAALARDHAWQIQREWLMWLPGLVTGLNVVSRAIGEDGDDVVTAVPVYHPFMSAPANQRRSVTQVPMRVERDRWVWDFEGLEASITPRTRLLLLCNPHNPVGRVFTRDELTELARVADQYDLIICSDEIHCGLVLDPDKPHLPMATLGEGIAARTITLMAASKTFNLPGLGCAFAVVSNPALRAKLARAAAGIVPRVNAMGFAATLAAYRDSTEWHRALIEYLRANRDFVIERIRGIPGLSITPIEATYLAWIGLEGRAIKDPLTFFENAGVGLYDGRAFGGEGYVRLNFGCPRSQLMQALDRIAAAMTTLRS